jgi:hypothetical protein
MNVGTILILLSLVSVVCSFLGETEKDPDQEIDDSSREYGTVHIAPEFSGRDELHLDS